MEGLLGPFAVGLADDDAGVEFGLDEWPPADRQTLAQALVEGEVPHRWDGATLIAATDAEADRRRAARRHRAGHARAGVGGPASAAPEGALDMLFSASDRLARDADDRSGRDDLRRSGRPDRPGRTRPTASPSRRGRRPSTRPASSPTSSHPGRMTHASVAGTALEVPSDLIRLSVGLEDLADLLADLDQALRG